MHDHYSGGCQCGAVRYAFESAPDHVHVCHCRMCQKAVGGPFAVICPVRKRDFRVTRGQLAWFASSDVARRGFCRECGTPMIFDYPRDSGIGILAGTLDHPELVSPKVQYGRDETGVPWFGGLPALPSVGLYADDPEGMLPRIQASNHQHPDHDTDQWPPG